MSDLKCFRIDHPFAGSCWCVTESQEEALTIAKENVFEEEPDFPFEVVLMEDAEPLSVLDEDTGVTETKTIRSWIDSYGEGTGFLCCSASLC